MSRTIDPRIAEGKRNRAQEVKKVYNEMYDEGLRDEVIIDTIIRKYGISQMTIYRILKGHYDNI